MNIDFGRDVVKCDTGELNTPPELTDPVQLQYSFILPYFLGNLFKRNMLK